MTTLMIGLFVLGLCFIALEVIVPGGILGGLGLLAILASWTLAFMEHGPVGGLLAVLIGLLIIGLMLFIEFRLIPRTVMGQRFFLRDSIGGTSQRQPTAEISLVGKEGEALTTLAPTGVVLIEGRKYEGFSMSGMVDRGARVEVVDFDNFRVRVTKV